MAAKRCRKPLVWDQTSAKSGSIASTQLLLGDVEHLALSLHVEARQPDGDEFDRGVVRALEYPDMRILYNDIHCFYTRCYGQQAYTGFRTPPALLIYVSTGLQLQLFLLGPTNTSSFHGLT